MKIGKILLWIIGLLVISIISLYAYYGGFGKVTPKIEKCGGETLVFEKVKGDYKQSAEVSDRVYQKLLIDHNIETTKGFGIYYDNPKITEKDKLRSEVGCILESDLNKIEVLKSGFEVSEYPLGDYLVAEFPFKGTPSVILGIMKVYPALNAHVKENGYALDSPVMEIWDIQNKRIIYRKELVNEQ